jgi:hypothetical protein
MVKQIALLAIVLLAINAASAQTTSPVFFNHDNNARKNTVGLGFTYENTLYAAVGYNRVVKIKHRNLDLGLEYGSPILLVTDRSQRIAVNGSIYLLNSDFNILSQLGISTNFYEDVLSKGVFMNGYIGLYPGYFKETYFVSAELSYKNNIFTTFNFTDISPVQGNDVVYNTTGNFYFGAYGGVFIKERLEMKARVFYNMPRDFQNYPPYTQNFGFNICLNYWF